MDSEFHEGISFEQMDFWQQSNEIMLAMSVPTLLSQSVIIKTFIELQ